MRPSCTLTASPTFSAMIGMGFEHRKTHCPPDLTRPFYPSQTASDAMESAVTCLHCLGPLKSCVTVVPCGHNLCGTCWSNAKQVLTALTALLKPQAVLPTKLPFLSSLSQPGCCCKAPGTALPIFN